MACASRVLAPCAARPRISRGVSSRGRVTSSLPFNRASSPSSVSSYRSSPTHHASARFVRHGSSRTAASSTDGAYVSGADSSGTPDTKKTPNGRPTPGTDERVLVVGGAGRVGTRMVTTLRSMGVETRVMTRDPSSEASAKLAQLGAEIVPGDVTDIDTTSLDAAVNGCTRVIACFGAQRISQPKDVLFLFNEDGGPSVTDQTHPAAVNHRGVERLAEACIKAGTIKRFVRVTGMSAGYPPFDFIAVALNAVLSMTIRFQRLGEIATRNLANHGIEYAIVRPGNLLEEPRPNGSVVIIGHNSTRQPSGKVSRDDVAECVLGAAFSDSAKNATIGISGKSFTTGGVTTEMSWDPARGMHYRAVELADEVFEGTDVHAMLGEIKEDTDTLAPGKYQPWVFLLVALLAGVFTVISAVVIAVAKKLLSAVVGMA